MTRKISKKQLEDFFFAEFAPKLHCCLCGGVGTIDTRGKVFTPAGYECGALVYCICPNGRALKERPTSSSGATS